jgi:glycosyltransferase involved in cell wall biosynthesis
MDKTQDLKFKTQSSNSGILVSVIVIVNPRWGMDIELLPECLESFNVLFDALQREIVLVISEKTKELEKIAKKFMARIVKQKGGSFADWRNLGAEEARGEWLLYVDCDERVTEELREEIKYQISNISRATKEFEANKYQTNSKFEIRNSKQFQSSKFKNKVSMNGISRGIVNLPARNDSYAGYAIPRLNVILGREMRHGGWWPDYVLRLMRRDKFLGYEGNLHEQPKVDGDIGYLRNHFLHLKSDRLEDYVVKTDNWSDREAELLIKAGHPRLSIWRFWRLTVHPFLTSFLNRYVMKRGLLDGTEGLIDAIYQSYSQFLSFAKLFEKQVSNEQ